MTYIVTSLIDDGNNIGRVSRKHEIDTLTNNIFSYFQLKYKFSCTISPTVTKFNCNLAKYIVIIIEIYHSVNSLAARVFLLYLHIAYKAYFCIVEVKSVNISVSI